MHADMHVVMCSVRNWYQILTTGMCRQIVVNSLISNFMTSVLRLPSCYMRRGRHSERARHGFSKRSAWRLINCTASGPAASTPLMPKPGTGDNTELFTHELTPWSWVLTEKPQVVQLLKNFPTFFGTWRFITVFTRVRHRSVSQAWLIQSVPFHPTSSRHILILSSHLRLGLPSGLYPSGSPTKTLYAFVFSRAHATYPDISSSYTW
jgi:hypothetical protein